MSLPLTLDIDTNVYPQDMCQAVTIDNYSQGLMLPPEICD